MQISKKINGNVVSFEDTEFELIQSTDVEYLHYIGNGGKVTQPKGYNNMHAMFIYFRGEELDLSDWDTGNYDNASEAFAHCANLRVIKGIENLNTGNLVTTNSMFCGCKNITELNLNRWNTSKLKDASGMFCDCSSLQHLYVSDWDMSYCADLSYFVNGCISLKELAVSNWNTSALRSVHKFACSCISLHDIDVSNWSSALIGELNGMFANCPQLAEQNLSKWGISDLALNKIYYSTNDETTNMNIF